MTATTDTADMTSGPRWDPLVRITHWGIALAVLLNGLITEEGESIHVWVGYAAFTLLALRLIWGFVGSAPARFSAFPPSLSAAKAHVEDLKAGRHPPQRSHNPLGALMAYALWATLAVITVTGIAMAGSPFSPRPEHKVESQAVAGGESEEGEYGEHGEEDEGEEILEEIHGAAANLILFLAAFHVAGVAFESRQSGRNLTRRMVTGG